jgi:hypothetical protein
VKSLRESTDAAIGSLLRDHTLGRCASDLALRDAEGLRGTRGIPRIEGLAAVFHHRAHLAADVLVALSAALGLADSLEGGFVVGQGGLSFGLGAAA